MKYEIVMRSPEGACETVVTSSFGHSSLYGDLTYVLRCLAECVFRVHHNGFKVARYIHRDINGQVVLWGFVTTAGCSYCIRKAIKQEKFDIKTR